MKTIQILYLISFLTLQSCASQTKFPVAVQEVSYQGWVAGVRGGGAGTNFSIQFKTKLPSNIVVKNIYFQNKMAVAQMVSPTICVANFISDANRMKEELVTDEPNPKKTTMEQVKPPFPIKENEAILEYTVQNKIKFFKFTNVKEKEMIPYPSAKPIE